jgi:type I restriction enzyme S subunit
MAVENNITSLQGSHCEERSKLKQSVSLLPKLRFKEFEGEWTKKTLKEVCKKIQDGNYGASYPKSEEFIKFGIPFLTSKALGGDGFLKDDKIDFISKEKHLELKKAQLKLNDVLFTNRGSNVGSIGFSDKRISHGNIGPQLTLLRSDLNIISPLFLFQIMTSHSVRKQVRSQDSGSAMNFFGIGATSKFKLNIPNLPEQQKIASFLTSVDTKIQQLTTKKQLLENYKKGVMQQLFSQQLRFKNNDGSDFPNWEIKDLDKIAKRNSIKNKGSKINFVLTNSATQGIVSQKEYFDRDIANQNNLEGYYIVQKDDFIYNPRISVHAPVGPIKRNKLIKGIMSPLYLVFSFNKENLEYFEFYFETFEWHKYLNSVANFGARHDRMNISNSDFFKMPIPLPSEIERRKIANYLNAIDTKIENVQTQIAKTQAFKKGLLQQMFV